MIKKQKTNFIDNMFKNMNKKNTNHNPINKILSVNNKNITTKKHYGASIPLQRQWVNYTPTQRTVNRILYKDIDRDGVPDRWDCQPRNPNKDGLWSDFKNKVRGVGEEYGLIESRENIEREKQYQLEKKQKQEEAHQNLLSDAMDVSTYEYVKLLNDDPNISHEVASKIVNKRRQEYIESGRIHPELLKRAKQYHSDQNTNQQYTLMSHDEDTIKENIKTSPIQNTKLKKTNLDKWENHFVNKQAKYETNLYQNTNNIQLTEDQRKNIIKHRKNQINNTNYGWTNE